MGNRKIPQKGGGAKNWGIPAGAAAASSYMELNGNRQVIVEGCGGVLEYDASVVRVKTGKLIAKFTGRDLVIKCLTSDSLVIEGYIMEIQFI